MTASLYDIPVRRIDGTSASLAEFKQHVMLIVNVASKCGLTKQYDGLEKLYEKYRGRGLVVAGFPANDFAQQEPGSNGEIQDFCTVNFGVKFPLFEKITVVGKGKHPLYRALTEAQPAAESTSEVPFREQLQKYGKTPNPQPEILWNFEKFLVSRAGAVVRRFAPDTQPDDPVLVNAVEALLEDPRPKSAAI
jgi:glutathione peroxidase